VMVTIVLDAEVKIGDTDTGDEAMETSTDEAEVVMLTEEDEVVRSTDEDEVERSTDEDEVERLTGDDEVRTTTDDDPEELRVETDTEDGVALDKVVVLKTGLTVTGEVVEAVDEADVRGTLEVPVGRAVGGELGTVPLPPVVPLGAPPAQMPWYAAMESVAFCTP